MNFLTELGRMVSYPEVQLVLLAIVLLLLEAFRPQTSPRILSQLAATGLVLILLGTLLPLLPETSWAGLYSIDAPGMFFKRFFLVTAIVVVLMAGDAAEDMPLARGEFVILPLFPTAGMLLLASATDFITIFVALELVTISFYVLVGYQRNSNASLEAGVKYLIIGALSTGFLVYGLAFLFGMVGSTSLAALEEYLVTNPVGPGLLFAVLMILIGLCFKIAAVPFHVWAPDTYQGAPLPVTTFLAVASKAAGFLVLLRIFAFNGFSHEQMTPFLVSILSVLAGASILLGNLAALPQRNLKRLLAYSGISHAGFLLMGLSCLNQRGVEAVLIYLCVYLLAALLAFSVIHVVSRQVGGDELPQYNGLSQRSPFLAFALMVAFISLAGIPPLAGFLGKLAVFAAVWESGQFWLLGIGVIGAVAGLYYYLGIVRAMYWNENQGESAPLTVSASNKAMIIVLLVCLLVVGVWQRPLGLIISRTLPSAPAPVEFYSKN